MIDPELEEFMTVLICEVRDQAVASCLSDVRPHAGSISAQRWRNTVPGNLEAAAAVLIPDAVDDAVFYLLRAIDQGRLRLQFINSNGTTVDVTEAGGGELAGWYMAAGRREFAQQPFADDFADLDLKQILAEDGGV